MERITSRQNAHFRLARKLAESARERNKSKQILMDGTRLIRAYAEQFGLEDATLLISESGVNRPDIQQILETTPPRHVYLLADELFAEIAQIDTEPSDTFHWHTPGTIGTTNSQSLPQLTTGK